MSAAELSGVSNADAIYGMEGDIMPKSRITEVIEQFLAEVGTNIQEDRLAEYIVNEVRKGRTLGDILEDANIKGKISSGHLAHVLERKEVLQEYEDKLKETVK